MEEKDAAAMSRSWSSELPTELLEMILRRLNPMDHLTFGKVCKSWRSARAIDSRGEPPTPQLPWLALHPWPRHHYVFLIPDDQSRCVLDQRTLLRVLVRDYENCLGSYNYWLVMRSWRRCYLVNPFTGAEAPLPYISCFEPCIAFSSDPLAGGGDGVMLVTETAPYQVSFQFCRFGQKHWLSDRLVGDDWRLKQVAAVGGKFYALTRQLRLVHIDVDWFPKAVIVNEAGKLAMDRTCEHVCLVESRGDLIAAIFTCLDCTVAERNMIKILKMDKVTSKWVALQREDQDLLLFLGANGSSMSRSASELGVRGTLIYIAGEKSISVYRWRGSSKAASKLKIVGAGKVSCACNNQFSTTWIAPQLLHEQDENKQGSSCLMFS